MLLRLSLSLFPSSPPVGQRVSQVMDILDELETKDDKFWLELLNHWLLQRPMVEVQAIPDPSFAEALELEKKQGELARQEALGDSFFSSKHILPENLRISFCFHFFPRMWLYVLGFLPR